MQNGMMGSREGGAEDLKDPVDRMGNHTDERVEETDPTEDAIGAQIVNNRALMTGRKVVGAGTQMSGCRGRMRAESMKEKHMIDCTQFLLATKGKCSRNMQKSWIRQ